MTNTVQPRLKTYLVQNIYTTLLPNSYGEYRNIERVANPHNLTIVKYDDEYVFNFIQFIEDMNMFYDNTFSNNIQFDSDGKKVVEEISFIGQIINENVSIDFTHSNDRTSTSFHTYDRNKNKIDVTSLWIDKPEMKDVISQIKNHSSLSHI